MNDDRHIRIYRPNEAGTQYDLVVIDTNGGSIEKTRETHNMQPGDILWHNYCWPTEALVIDGPGESDYTWLTGIMTEDHS